MLGNLVISATLHLMALAAVGPPWGQSKLMGVHVCPCHSKKALLLVGRHWHPRTPPEGHMPAHQTPPAPWRPPWASPTGSSPGGPPRGGLTFKAFSLIFKINKVYLKTKRAPLLLSFQHWGSKAQPPWRPPRALHHRGGPWRPPRGCHWGSKAQHLDRVR